MSTQYVDEQNAYHYCELWKITGENVRIFSNPHSDGFADDSLHFQVRLSQGDLHADFFWSCGSGTPMFWAAKNANKVGNKMIGQGVTHKDVKRALNQEKTLMDQEIRQHARDLYPGPDAAELVDCLISDSDALDDSFEDWCQNLGYEANSHKAFRTYKQCRENANKLHDLIGPQCFEAMRGEMERL